MRMEKTMIPNDGQSNVVDAALADRRLATDVHRRVVLKTLAGLGIGSVTFSRALAAQATAEAKISTDMIQQAAWIAGMEFTDEERELMRKGVNDSLAELAALREVPLDNGVPPAFAFYPSPPQNNATEHPPGRATPSETAAIDRPASDDDLAFAPVSELAALLRTRRVSSVELTKLYLDRLRRYDATLQCVINYTESTALRLAESADREIAAGRYRGPLHGVPWGAKDLLAYPGFKTTWGAKPYENQVREEKATVAAKLDRAGAVIVAKLSAGALAWGDVWFGGTTKNPWKPEQGSSGSSAGPASATSAGLVGFAIGTETWGSIVSPCTRCGVTGLRPTFGRVSRYGTMALSWTMDKMGPIARSVEDCALVFDVMRGRDGLDTTVVDRPFQWPPPKDVRTIRVGYVAELFDEDRSADIPDETFRKRVAEQQSFDRATLDALRGLGVKLVPIKLPTGLPIGSLSLILTAEAATAFDHLTRSGDDDQLTRQIDNAWPNVFRQGQLIPAVEYIRANRVRTLIIQALEKEMEQVDVYVAPSFGGNNLLLTNLTGHPAVVLPNGFRTGDGTPTSITFTGRLYGETDLLTVAHAYQRATDFNLKRPPIDAAAAKVGS